MITAIVVVALLATIVLASVALSHPVQAQGEVVTQPTSSVGNNPFTPSVANPETSPSTNPSPPSAPSQSLTSVTGTSAGLYGGTRNNWSCDRQKMIDYLKANPDKAAAWAAVEGIAVTDIAIYINGLTPVVLRYDTRVTNHGFYNGVATPYQAVLQAGTAVLADRFGVPRARCYCGNPLLPPIPVAYTPTYTGPRWTNFSTTTIIIVVVPVQPVVILTLAGPNGQAFGRPVGTDGSKDGKAPPPGPPPSPAPSPTGSPNPLNGNYTMTFTGPGTLIGNGPDVTATDCAGGSAQLPANSRVDVVVSGGTVSMQFADATASGPLGPDNSFSVELKSGTPPPTQPGGPVPTNTLKGRFDGQGGFAGNVEVVGTFPAGKEGCSLPYQARKVA